MKNTITVEILKKLKEKVGDTDNKGTYSKSLCHALSNLYHESDYTWDDILKVKKLIKTTKTDDNFFTGRHQIGHEGVKRLLTRYNREYLIDNYYHWSTDDTESRLEWLDNQIKLHTQQ